MSVSIPFPSPAQHIHSQFNDKTVQQELRDMSDAKFDWNARVTTTMAAVLPRLPALALDLSIEIPRLLNSPIHTINKLQAGSASHPELRIGTLGAWYDDVCQSATASKALVENLESQQISNAIQRFLLLPTSIGDIFKSNGPSIYPDLLLKSHDYSNLPIQNRINPIDGPCLRGGNASNVPDGMEIKTNRGARIKVDAHGAHPGLHFGVTWDFDSVGVVIKGVWVAYIGAKDYHHSNRNVSSTTVKCSFGHDLFASLM